jgi:hypothetical protein
MARSASFSIGANVPLSSAKWSAARLRSERPRESAVIATGAMARAKAKAITIRSPDPVDALRSQQTRTTKPTLGVAVRTPVPKANPNSKANPKRPRAPHARGTRHQLRVIQCTRPGRNKHTPATNPTPSRGKLKPVAHWIRKAVVARATAPARSPATYAAVAMRRSPRPRPEGATIAKIAFLPQSVRTPSVPLVIATTAASAASTPP